MKKMNKKNFLFMSIVLINFFVIILYNYSLTNSMKTLILYYNRIEASSINYSDYYLNLSTFITGTIDNSTTSTSSMRSVHRKIQEFDSTSKKRVSRTANPVSITVTNIEKEINDRKINISIYPNRNEQIERINAFKENHRKIVKTLSPIRFAYVMPDTGGYGNKIIQIINAFTVALVTSSAVILNITEINKYIQEPLYNCFITNKNVKNHLNYLYDKNTTYVFPKNTPNSWKYEKNLSNLFTEIPKTFTRFVFDGMFSMYFELACNKNYFEKFLYYGLVKPETIIQSLEALEILNSAQKTPRAYSHLINVLFRTGFELAHNIMNIFWHPKTELQKQIDKFVEENLKDFYVIGIQIRTEFLKVMKDRIVFFECATELEKLNAKNKTVKWFVACDDPMFLKDFKKEYPDKIIHADGSITHIYLQPEGYLKAILDTELLSKCDLIIITGLVYILLF